MAMYLVSYDLIGPNRDYEAVTEHLRTYGTRAKPLKSVWIIESSKTAGQIRDDLKKHLDGNDRAIVLKLDKSGWATRNIETTTSEWIKRNL